MIPKIPVHSMIGDGYRTRGDGRIEPIVELQLFFYESALVSGTFTCRIPESPGYIWLFENATIHNGRLQFDMVHVELQYPRDSYGAFVGQYDGEGSYVGTWSSKHEAGHWQITLRGTVEDLPANYTGYKPL